MVLGIKSANEIRVMLVEDDPDDVDFMLMAMQDDERSFDVLTLTDGEKALLHLLSAKALPDVVVLDLNLPKVDGREVLKALKADIRFSGIPVIVHTTSKSERDIAYCASFAVDRFITKTSTLDGLKVATEAIKELAA